MIKCSLYNQLFRAYVAMVVYRHQPLEMTASVKLDLSACPLSTFNTMNTELSPHFRDTLLFYEGGLERFPLGTRLSFPRAMLLIYINKITNSWGIPSGALLRLHGLPRYCCPEGICSNDCDPQQSRLSQCNPASGSRCGRKQQSHGRSLIATY